MDGIGLVAALQDLNAFLQIIMTSGAIGKDQLPDVPFIAKPYDLERARELVFSTIKVRPRTAE
jgi:hypothetical protein